MAAVTLIFPACDSDSGNNGSGPEVNASSSTGKSSTGGQTNSSSVDEFPRLSVEESSFSVVICSSSAGNATRGKKQRIQRKIIK